MIYAATIFLSSFLLFLVQPLIARQILPWFGGTAAVWTTCMLFFQTLLLAGYAYAHATNAKLAAARAGGRCTRCCSSLALATLPIAPSEGWKPLGTEEPISPILLVLAATVGLPYLLLASTSPLLQAWFARARPGADPYRLFAVSNLASLLALVGYPLLVEPFLGNREQVVWWSVLFAVFAVLCVGIVLVCFCEKSKRRNQGTGKQPSTRPRRLPALAGAVGDRLGAAARGDQPRDAERGGDPAAVARAADAVPAHLHPRLRGRKPGSTCTASRSSGAWCWSGSPAWPGCWWIRSYQFDLWMQLGMFLSGLFVACMFCHGELYRARPGGAPPHRVLPDHLRRRRDRRPAGRGGGAARVQRLLRARPGAGRARAAGGGALRAGEPRRALGEPRDAAGGGGLRRLRRRALPQGRAASRSAISTA